METHTHENKVENCSAFYTAVAIIFLAITVIYPLAYVGMMYLATKLQG